MDDGRGSFITAPNLESLRGEVAKQNEVRLAEDRLQVSVDAIDSLKAERIFCVGETVTVKGSAFRVVNIMRHTLILRLLAHHEIPTDVLTEMARYKKAAVMDGKRVATL